MQLNFKWTYQSFYLLGRLDLGGNGLSYSATVQKKQISSERLDKLPFQFVQLYQNSGIKFRVIDLFIYFLFVDKIKVNQINFDPKLIFLM